MSQTSYPIIALVIVMLMGLLSFGIGCFLLLRNILFFRKAVLVYGKVVDYASKLGGKGQIMYTPIVQYELGGEIKEVKGSVFSCIKPTIGKYIKVGINPDNIEDVRVEQWSSLIVIIPIMLAGAFFASFAIFALIFWKS